MSYFNQFNIYKKRISSLLARTIDQCVKNGILETTKIVDIFINNINCIDMETWKSLKPFTNNRNFYDECIKYVDDKKSVYIERNEKLNYAEKCSDQQAEYLSVLIKKGIKSKDSRVILNTMKELQGILKLLSVNGANKKINKMKEIVYFRTNTK